MATTPATDEFSRPPIYGVPVGPAEVPSLMKGKAPPPRPTQR